MNYGGLVVRDEDAGPSSPTQPFINLEPTRFPRMNKGHIILIIPSGQRTIKIQVIKRSHPFPKPFSNS